MGNRKLLQRSLWAGPTAAMFARRKVSTRAGQISEDTKFNVRKPSKTLGGTQILRELVRSRFTK